MSAPNGAQTMKPRTGNTLIVQSLTDYPLRSAIRDHVFAFRRYSANRCFYLNVPAQRPSRLLRRRRYDLPGGTLGSTVLRAPLRPAAPAARTGGHRRASRDRKSVV